MRTHINKRLFVDAKLGANSDLVLDRDQSHYLANVLRAKTGMPVALFNGQDGEWEAHVATIEKRSVTLNIIRQLQPQRDEPDVWLVFAPIKKTRIDFVAQKATELGASKLVPMMTSRTIAERVNTERLYANAIEAAEQCERLTVPDVSAPENFRTIIAHWPAERHIMFCDESLSGKAAQNVLEAHKQHRGAPWAIFIGPEGGFEENERAALLNLPNAHPVSIGPRILRADTAAMAALSIWQSVLGDWSP